MTNKQLNWREEMGREKEGKKERKSFCNCLRNPVSITQERDRERDREREREREKEMDEK